MDELNNVIDTLSENYDELDVDIKVDPNQPAQEEDGGSVRLFEGNTAGDLDLFSGSQGDNNLMASGDLSVGSPDEVNPDVSNLVGGTGNSTRFADLLTNTGDPGLLSGDGNTAPVAANTGDPGLISGEGNISPFLGNAGDGNKTPLFSNTGEQDKPFATNTGESSPELFGLDPVNNGDGILNLSDLIHEPNTNLTNSTDLPAHFEIAGGTTGSGIGGALDGLLNGGSGLLSKITEGLGNLIGNGSIGNLLGGLIGGGN